MGLAKGLRTTFFGAQDNIFRVATAGLALGQTIIVNQSTDSYLRILAAIFPFNVIEREMPLDLILKEGIASIIVGLDVAFQRPRNRD